MRARRWWAWPLAPLYAAVLAAKDALRAAGVLKVRSLAWPVVSVGSLSVGGAGKTPVVIALARLMSDHGWQMDVLSRGYGRHRRGVERVPEYVHEQKPRAADLAGAPENELQNPDAAARRFGDEPVLMARRAGVPVWVGAERWAAGRLAERKYGGQGRSVHLLDDGFQHRQLARAFDVVLVTTEDLNDALLPAGNRRERWSALRRADAVVVREDEFDVVGPRVREYIGVDTPICAVRRFLRFPAPLGVLSAGLRPVAFCAIARPESFAHMLAEAGCGVVETIAFADHHFFSPTDMCRVVEVATRLKATGFLITEKDEVKLTQELRTILARVGPVAAVALDVEFAAPEEVLRVVEERLA